MVNADRGNVVACLISSLRVAKVVAGLSGSIAELNALKSIYRLFTHYVEAEFDAAYQIDQQFRHPVRGMHKAIPQIIVKMPGASAHAALRQMAHEAHGDRNEYESLINMVVEHSVLEAESQCPLLPEVIAKFGESYYVEPRTSFELKLQVVA
jgi:hypothetical protein